MASKFPLAGLKVLEFAGLAPVPFAGMILADFGANVCRIDRYGATSLDVLGRGKQSISINLKAQEGVDIIKKLVRTTDVIVEPFRPGIMEKLNLGPNELLAINDKLIYTRLNGYGAQGNLSNAAGHDINYLAISGILSKLGVKDGAPHPPINLLGDFAGGSMVAVNGILMALLERTVSGKGQVVETSITEGASYVSSFIHRSRDMFIWNSSKRGSSLLDGGAHFYNTYETKDGRFMAVGCIEPQFYAAFIKGLDVECDLTDQMDPSTWDTMKDIVAQKFKTKTQQEWVDIFTKLDACVTPILSMDEAAHYDHNIKNNSFMKDPDGNWDPSPAPKLSRTPGVSYSKRSPDIGENTVEILRGAGYNNSKIEYFLENGIVEQCGGNSKL